MLGCFRAKAFASRLFCRMGLMGLVGLVLLVLGCQDVSTRTRARETRSEIARTSQALSFGPNAIAYWPFDGTAADPASAYDLALAGGATYAPGLFGQALALDGNAANYAQRPGDDAAFDFGSSDFTLQVWVRFSAIAGVQTLLEKFLGPAGPGWTLTKLADDSLEFYALPATSMTSAALGFAPNVWTQIVVRRTGTLFELLRDGAVVASATSADPLPDTAQPLLVGRREGLQQFPLSGRMDELAIFGRALSNAEVGSLYNGGAGRRVATSVTIAPASTNLPPRGATTFVGSGGVGTSTSFSWSLQTNASGATLDPASGAYAAGATPNVVDVVLATDAAGNTATANVNVGAGVSISPASPTSVAPQGSLQLTAAGGSAAGYTWSVRTNASGATVSATGLYKAGTTANVTDTVRVTDGLGNTADVNVPVGAGVAISPAAPTVAPRQSITFSATGGSGAGYTWALVQNGSGATLTGAVYTAGSAGSTVDRVRVTDGLGNTTTVDVSIGPALAVTPLSTTAAPNGSITFSTTGGSGTITSWALVTNASGGTLSPAGVYKAGATGSVTDAVRATDSLGATATATVAVSAGVTVTPSAPSVAPRGSISFGASGGSNTGFAWTLPTNASGATIDGATGAYTAGTSGSKTDIVRVTDSLGNTKNVSVTVGPGVSIAPANPAAPPLGSVQLTATGGSATGFTWSLTTNASGGSVDGSGLFTAGPTGNVSDTVQVTDALGNVATVSVSVGGGISINPATPTSPPRGSLALVVTGGSGAGYQWAFVTNASGGTIGNGSGAYKAGPTGNVTDVVKVTDGLGNTKSVSIVVGAGASISPSVVTLAPLGTASFAAAGGSGTGFTFTLSTNGSTGSVGASTGAYKAGAKGSVSDVVTVTDSLGNTASATLNVTKAMTLSPVATTVAPRGAASFAASGGAGSYAFSLQSNASGGNIAASSGAYTAGARGGVSDVVRAVDANGAVVLATVIVGKSVTISPSPAQAPPLGKIAFTAAGGSGFGYVWELATAASGGTIDPATGEYTAGETANTFDTVRVSDSLGNVAIVGVSVGNPIAITPGAGAVPPRGGIAFSATGGSGSSYTWALRDNASGGTLDAATGAYRAGPRGNAVDVVEVTDAVGGKATATVDVSGSLTLSPETTTLAAGSSATFTVGGGSGEGFTWSVEPNLSGAKLGQDGVYVAGAKAGIDVVVVRDGLGNEARARVTVIGNTGVPSGVGGSAGLGVSPTTPADDNACGCRAAGGGPRPLGGVSAALGAAALLLLRRARRVNSTRDGVRTASGRGSAPNPRVSPTPGGRLPGTPS